MSNDDKMQWAIIGLVFIGLVFVVLMSMLDNCRYMANQDTRAACLKNGHTPAVCGVP